MTVHDNSSHYEWLDVRFPQRARPVGFYPLPTTRTDAPFIDQSAANSSAHPRFELLYIHVPFCNQRCHYCRFYPGPNSSGIENKFLDGLSNQLVWWSEHLSRRDAEVAAVFLGGGSPSALSVNAVHQLFAIVRQAFTLAPDAEVTMEWYPGDLEPEKLRVAVEAGVNRLSVGAQSWNSEVLAHLGCHHDGRQIDAVLEHITQAGITNFNLDLMCNVPGQTIENHLDDIGRAAEAGAAMISTNILELASGTPYSAVGGTEFPDAEKRTWLREASSALRALGFAHQRTRNFYRDGALHRYNRHCAGLDFDIIPAGPGAYGYVRGTPVISNPDRVLWHQQASTGAITGYATATEPELRRAHIVNSLLELHLNAHDYAERFGSSPFEEFPILQELAERDILHLEAGVWRLSQAGIEYADDICVSVYSNVQNMAFAHHLNVGRSRERTQYFPISLNAPSSTNPDISEAAQSVNPSGGAKGMQQ